MEVKVSELKTGDIVLVRGKFMPPPFNFVTRFFTQGFRHSFIYYGENERGGGLILEAVARCGPTISPLRKYLGANVEVYRMEHPEAPLFFGAIFKAGEAILTKKYLFFDWPLIFCRSLAAKLGFSGRIKSKYYPFFFCSEFLQVCLEDAVNHLDGPVSASYKKDILARLPRRLMFPIDFRALSFLKNVKRGKLVS